MIAGEFVKNLLSEFVLMLPLDVKTQSNTMGAIVQYKFNSKNGVLEASENNLVFYGNLIIRQKRVFGRLCF